MRVLCVGDVFGKVGRKAIAALLPGLIDRHALDLVVVNGENAAGGVGLTVETTRDLLAQPVDVLTSGNHIWKHKEILSLLDKEPRLLRPMNYPAGTPGRGSGVFETAGGVPVGVVDLEGRVFMEPLLSPFDVADQAIAELSRETRIILVEIHAEATSEKRALGWHLAGRASAVFGTHTHVPTADEEVLEGGTGYITDLGMTGPYDSVIGMRKEEVLHRFRAQRPAPFVAAVGDVRLCGAIFDIDPETGRCTAVERVCERMP
jgi:2',3'-cyclic-nucleotide 2'-phosphodiesterase